MVVAAYGLILPREVLAIHAVADQYPRLAPAALARCRPIQRALLAGDRETVSPSADGRRTRHRPVLLSVSTPIAALDTAQTLLIDWRRSAPPHRARAGRAWRTRGPDDSAATYAARSTSAKRSSIGANTALMIERKVRAFNPVQAQ